MSGSILVPVQNTCSWRSIREVRVALPKYAGDLRNAHARRDLTNVARTPKYATFPKPPTLHTENGPPLTTGIRTNG